MDHGERSRQPFRRKAKSLRKEIERGNRLLELFEKAPLLSEKQLYDFALDQAVALTDSEIGFFHLVSDDQTGVVLTTWNAEALKGCSAAHDNHYPIESAGNWVDCVRLKRPVMYNDYAASPNQKGLPPGHLPVRRFMSIPVMEGEKVRIIFGVGNKREEYDENDVVHIQLVANELQKIIRQRRAEEALRQSEEKYRTLIQRIPAAVVVYGADTRVIISNSRAQEILGLTEDQMAGKTAADSTWRFVRDDGNPLPPEEFPVNRVLATKRPLRNCALGVHRPNGGKDAWILVNADPVPGETQEIDQVIVTFVDVTERKLLESEGARMNRALRMLSDTSQALVHIAAEQALLDEVCRIAVEVGGYRMGLVSFADHDAPNTLRPVAHAGLEEAYIPLAAGAWADDERGQGPSSVAVRSGVPSISRYLRTNAGCSPWQEEAIRRGYESVIALPIVTGGETLGTFGIYSDDPDAFDAREVAVLKEVTDGLAFGIAALRMRLKREQAEEALRESEERYRLIVENTADTIAIFDLGLGLVWVSPTIKTIRGYTAEERMHQSLEDMLTPESLETARRVFAEEMALEATGTADPSRTTLLELRERCKDGSTMWVELSASLLRDSESRPTGILTVTRDLTRRKEAELRLVQSEQKFRSLAESSPDTIIRYDADCRPVYVNHATDASVGLIMQGMETDECSTRLRRVIATGEPDEVEIVLNTAAGETRTHTIRLVAERSPDGAIIGALALGRDVTEGRRAEVEVRRLTHAIEQSPVSVIMTATSGSIEYVNPKFTEITGYAREEVLGRNPRILKTGETGLTEYQQLWATITAGREWRGEFHNRKKNGELFWESASISPVRDERGVITHFIAIKEDITEKKGAEEERERNEIRRRELERELRQAQKLESLGTLASGIAHDFNNILGIIMGQSSLLKGSMADPAKLLVRINAIDTAAGRGASLVKQLLMFARKSESLFESVSVNPIAAEVAKLLQETLQKTVVVSTDLEADVPPVVADATQLHQVLLNLCINARDAMPMGGTLTIATARVGYEAVASRFPRASAPEYVVVSVADTGVGMDDATRERAFEPFFTTKGPGKGSGLGLALVHSIVEAHHGMIAVDSAPGRGSAFHVYFPVEEHGIDLPATSRGHDEFVAAGTETILLIEDEDMLSDLVRGILVDNGYGVVTARDGEEGVAQFLRHRERIALVLSDVGLPKFGGEEVFRRIRAIDPNARIVLSSGFIDPETKARMAVIGATRFLQKPYSPSEVLRVVRTALDWVEEGPAQRTP